LASHRLGAVQRGRAAYDRAVRRRRGGIAGVDIIEWRPLGHRMTYVASIVRVANDAGINVVLWTTPQVLETDEFDAQLSGFISNGQLTTNTSSQLGNPRGLLTALGEIRRQDRAAILPEADRYLHLLLLGLVSGQLPRNTTAIVMRPPRAVSGRWRGWLGSIVKTALVVVLVMSRRVDVQLLEDPLAEDGERLWTGPLKRESLRLDDPCSLLDIESGELPVELQFRTRRVASLALVGVIDHRKNVPLIIRAWQLAAPPDAALIIAGKQSPSVSSWLAEAEPLPENVILINRYLSESEVRGILEQSNGILTLYDGGLSSGVMVAAAAVGRWVIVLEGTRTGRVAAQKGFGLVCKPSPPALADAMLGALSNTSKPPPLVVPRSGDFGRRVLRLVLDPRDNR
jgi:glycosyltransferase involved in cell wall biosynthesis